MKTKLIYRAALLFSSIVLVSSTSYAQPGGGRPGGGPFGRGGGPGGIGGLAGMMNAVGAASFAIRSDVSKELDLSEDQMGELRELAGSSPRGFQLMQQAGIDFRALRDMSEEEREKAMAEAQKTLAKINEEANEKAMEVLTSKQKSRFRELKFQYDITRGQAIAALADADVELGDDEQKKLTESLRDADAKLQARINELRLEMYVEALGSVVSESKVKQMMGETFVFDSRGRGTGFGRAGAGPRRPRGGGDAGGENPRRPQRPESQDEAENPRRRRRGD